MLDLSAKFFFYSSLSKVPPFVESQKSDGTQFSNLVPVETSRSRMFQCETSHRGHAYKSSNFGGTYSNVCVKESVFKKLERKNFWKKSSNNSWSRSQEPSAKRNILDIKVSHFNTFSLHSFNPSGVSVPTNLIALCLSAAVIVVLDVVAAAAANCQRNVFVQLTTKQNNRTRY